MQLMLPMRQKKILFGGGSASLFKQLVPTRHNPPKTKKNHMKISRHDQVTKVYGISEISYKILVCKI